MPFTSSKSIPQINYATHARSSSGSSYSSSSTYAPSSCSSSSTYAPSSYAPSKYSSSTRFSASPCVAPPSSRDVQSNWVSSDEHVSLKAHLYATLKKGRLPNMPMGFPFHCAGGLDGKAASSYAISYDSYEFPEYAYLGTRSQPQCAMFSYTAPSFGSPSRTGSPSRMMTWRIAVPSRDPTHPRQSSSSLLVAQVEIDPLVMESPLGLDFITNPSNLLLALRVSLETGLRITVQVSDARTPALYPSRRGADYEAGEIVFISTNASGRSEVVYVFDT